MREHLKKTRRSPKWEHFRDEFLKGRFCASCGGTKSLQAHHIKPYHTHKELELDPLNLIPLCMGRFDCHLFIGHGGRFDYSNPNVVKDAAAALSYPPKRRAIESLAKSSRVAD